jgi:hypothetical protein
VLNHAIDHTVLLPALTDKRVCRNGPHGYLLEEPILTAVQILPVLILLIVIFTVVILERVQVMGVYKMTFLSEIAHPQISDSQ